MEADVLHKVGFGGGCHWCTEAVFQHIQGVYFVEQGWFGPELKPNESIAFPGDDSRFSEGVIVHYDPQQISLDQLIDIHLETHSSESNHSRRERYKSRVYAYGHEDLSCIRKLLAAKKKAHGKAYITQGELAHNFLLNKPEFLNYYLTRPDAPFCEGHIKPKLKKLLRDRPESIKANIRKKWEMEGE